MNNEQQYTQPLILGWWNTSLSYARKKQNRPNYSEKIDIAKKIVQTLVQQGVDFLGLAEVNDDDLQQLKNAVANFGYKAIECTEKAGKTHFDLGILYNPQTVYFLGEPNFLIDAYAETHTLKTALRLDIQPAFSDKPFHIFMSHWPSPLTQDEKEKKGQMGMRLKDYIDEFNPEKEDSYVIVMGDFNEAPFSTSLTQLATRDRGMLLKKKTFLYNPFWRHLGEHIPFHWNMNTSDNFCGTYFYSGGTITRWHTFDQMMFSSNFITSSEWYLDERYSLIWNPEPLINFEVLRKYKFDHLPIISAVTLNPSKEDITYERIS